MRDKIKSIPFLGKLLGYIYYYAVTAYKFITHKLLRKYISQHRWNKMKREILRDFSDSPDNEIRELTENIRKQGNIRTFNYPFYEQYGKFSVKVFMDYAAGGYPYVMHKVNETERRLYFPAEWEQQKVADVYWRLLAEQDKDSPHCYEDEECSVENGAVVLDIGVAEGNFSVGCVDRAKHIYLFEGDSIWWKPLELTFQDWKEKVTLVPKYVSDIDDGQYISLAAFLKEKKFMDEPLFIKMDIEGYEERVLTSCVKDLADLEEQGVGLTMAVCCYHKQESEKEIRKIFSQIGFDNIRNSKGFMILNWFCGERIYPYFRRGILFASKKAKRQTYETD